LGSQKGHKPTIEYKRNQLNIIRDWL